eukprot:TRINITY_DN3373_c0_g1_i1.p1 TRINITY_DN3373_c0_g1~~TRINITY_DN3373_c0_g1_i1.p1  ORF type:complete len:1453 (+),score=496.86 TRINITY_DN3373_c0_g1_i1:143-4501(+)
MATGARSSQLAVPKSKAGVRMSVLDMMKSSAIMQGWLSKRGPNARFGWRKVWCLLLEEELVYYADERCWEKKGDVPLRPLTRVIAFTDPMVTGEGPQYAKSNPLGFVIDPGPPGKKRHFYYFDALSEDAHQAWMNGLSGLIESRKNIIDSLLLKFYDKAGLVAERRAVRGEAENEAEAKRASAARSIQMRARGMSGRRRADGVRRGCDHTGKVAPDLQKNRAFIFIKPHANTEAVRKLVKRTLQDSRIAVVEEGEICGKTIDRKQLIDIHYYAIASKATLVTPDKLPVPAEKFKEKFGEDWSEVLAAGRAANAAQASEAFGLNPEELQAEWKKLQQEGSVVKFGGGFYCGKMSVKDKELYVFNAFFMSMRAKFTAPEKSIYYYSVVWQPGCCTWKNFRGSVLGSTNPAEAAVGSLRRSIYDRWEALGLPAQPDTGDNGVHGSASPFEGLAERMNWLGKKASDDPFGAAILGKGFFPDLLQTWKKDARVAVGEGEEGSIFDYLEDKDVQQCADDLMAAHVLNLDATEKSHLEKMKELVGEEAALQDLKVHHEQQLAASTRIQSAQRGKKARARVRNIRQDKKEKAVAGGETPEVVAPAGDAEKLTAEEAAQLTVEEQAALQEAEADKEKAASKIQARFRGNKGRARVKQVKSGKSGATSPSAAASAAGSVPEETSGDAAAPETAVPPANGETSGEMTQADKVMDIDSNRAFLFIKPHAQTEAVRKVVTEKLRSKSISILAEGEVTAADMDAKKLVDNHYYAIASNALHTKPEDLKFSAHAFRELLDEDWDKVLVGGLAKNAAEAQEAFGLDPQALEAEWMKSSPKKLASGLYCAKMNVNSKELFVFNAFYPAMRAKYLVEGASIYYYSLQWKPADCSFEEFRSDVLGSTDPAAATQASLRREIYDTWESLGLKTQPNKGDNGIHASASPFEAMAERVNWLGTAIEEDPFGAALLNGGMKADTITSWCKDAHLIKQDGEVGVFEGLEDLDTQLCLSKLFELEEQAFFVGDRCAVKGLETEGTIRFRGVGHFAPGLWVGIELDQDCGKNDGCVKDVRYFNCKPQYGIFVRPLIVTKLAPPEMQASVEISLAADIKAELQENGQAVSSEDARAASAMRIQKQARGKLARNKTKSLKVGGAGDLEWNRAFVFVKPHANTEAVQKLVKQTLRDASMYIMKQGTIAAAEIDAKELIDTHYYSIASKATLLKPEQLPVPAEQFKEKFGEDWDAVLKESKAANAKEAAAQFGLDSAGLETAWKQLPASEVAKFGGGFYCGKMTVGEKTLYVFNAFFMAMRSKYTEPGKSIYYYVVKWQPGDCNWSEFRDAVVGATDPAEAAEGSMRRTIFQKWQELGLPAEPNKGDNGVHASASAFEALSERLNWLEGSCESDAFGAAVLEQGLSEELLLTWGKDARVKLNSKGEEGSVFDALECLDSRPCCERLVELAALAAEKPEGAAF